MEKQNFKCKIEELPFIALLVADCLKRDKELFHTFSPVYNVAFISSLKTKINDVRNLTNSYKLTAEMKAITRRISGHYTDIRNTLNCIELYLEQAKEKLPIAVDDFGLKDIRKEIKFRNDEGVVLKLKTLFKSLDTLEEILKDTGYTPKRHADFKRLIDSLSADCFAQTRKLRERKETVAGNLTVMNELWDILSEIMSTGKVIAKEKKNLQMKKDYTFRELQKSVRMIRKKNNRTDENSTDKAS